MRKNAAIEASVSGITGQHMSDEERTKRLNAAFDALGDGLTEAELADMTTAMTGVKTVEDVLRYRDRIRALARENRVTSIHVFEEGPDDAALCLHGHLGFLVFSAEAYKMRHLVRLFQGLRELLGFPPDLVDAKSYAETVVAKLVKRAVEI